MNKVNINLHILIIPSWYPQFEGDIGGSFFREQAHALRNSGHKVGVIYPQVRSIKNLKGLYSKSYGKQYINDNGLNTYKFHHLAIPKLTKVQNQRWVKHGLKIFEEYIKNFGMPDIIHVHSLKPAGYLALKINSKYQIPFVVTEHSSMFARYHISESDIQSLGKIIAASSYNIGVSKQFCNLLDGIFEFKKWQYIPNIVNKNFLDSDIDPPNGKNEFIYLSICSLTHIKAIDNLIRAFALIHKKTLNAILYIGGDGEERNNLEKLVKDLNLEDRVIFLGSLSREKVRTEMAKSSVFVLPSRYETFGVVLVEALALGKPIIATKCGGPESIINDKVGTLVEVDNIKELSKAMLEAYITPDKYNSNDIRQYCIDNFSEKTVTSKLTKIYHSVLTGLNQ